MKIRVKGQKIDLKDKKAKEKIKKLGKNPNRKG